jgi:hypothetical protein
MAPFMRTNYQSLSLFRILFALYLGVDFFANILPWYSDFYTDQGILPRADLLAHYHGHWVPTLLLLSDRPLFHLAFITLHILALLAFGLGYRTRSATLVLFITFTSLYWRNYLVNSGAEMLVRLFLLWSLFLPLARYWSIDAALDPRDPTRPYPKLLLAGIRIQIAMIYILSACNKIAGTPWLDGTAIDRALHDNMFGGTTAGLWVADQFAPFLPLLTWGTIIFQFAFTPLVYCPWYNWLTRAFALAGAAAMHISFIFLLNVGPFPFLCVTYLVILIPDTWWDYGLRQRRTRLAAIRIYYDPDCVFCQKTALLFRTFCLVPVSPVLPADTDAAILATLQAEKSWVVCDSAGNQRLHWRAVAWLLRQSPVFAPFGWVMDLPLLRTPLRRLYDWIGRHRTSFGRVTAVLLPFRAPPVPGKAMQALCAILLTIALTYSVAVLPKPAFKSPWVQTLAQSMPASAPTWLAALATWTDVQQKWNLFAPSPTGSQWRFVLTGTEANGATIDLLDRWHPRPLSVARNGYGLTFYSHRLLKYFSRLEPLLKTNPAMVSNYLCRKINDGVIPDQAITEGQIAFYKQPFNLQNSPLTPRTSYRFSCPVLHGQKSAS